MSASYAIDGISGGGHELISYEINEGCEKIVPGSESFLSNLRFLRMIYLTIEFKFC